ncbi:Hypothetical predicted protein [Mytilus galloprovincialis]|uniref:Uncharacterized protein n=1 Tax=Mytilus galloprovincialis TaxID=29158 RepID=A0A8B6G0F3_MYTGA|nr:Hypothetical predicted protein [Mytilus galloprovincialis]
MTMIAALVLLTVTPLVMCGVQVMNEAGLKDVDIETRREVLGKIVDKLNSIALVQRSLIDGCEEKINNTVDECNTSCTCRQDLCQSIPSVDKVVLNMLSTGVYTAIAFAGTALKDAGEWFKTPVIGWEIKQGYLQINCQTLQIPLLINKRGQDKQN